MHQYHISYRFSGVSGDLTLDAELLLSVEDLEDTRQTIAEKHGVKSNEVVVVCIHKFERVSDVRN